MALCSGINGTLGHGQTLGHPSAERGGRLTRPGLCWEVIREHTADVAKLKMLCVR